VEAAFAVAPTAETLALAHKLVAKAYGPGVELAPTIDPALIAGFRLVLDGRRVDASMAGRLQRMRMGLRNPARLKSRKHATPAH
jgi:F0F1-type ATP synthase delta subunit